MFVVRGREFWKWVWVFCTTLFDVFVQGLWRQHQVFTCSNSRDVKILVQSDANIKWYDINFCHNIV